LVTQQTRIESYQVVNQPISWCYWSHAKHQKQNAELHEFHIKLAGLSTLLHNRTMAIHQEIQISI